MNSRFDIFGNVLGEVVGVLQDVVHGQAPRSVVHLLVPVHLKWYKFVMKFCLQIRRRPQFNG